MAGDFAYLIRFLDNEGKEYYGNLIEAKAAINLIGSKAQVVLGNPFDGLTVTDEEKTISKVLCPLKTTPIFQCIGVNYARHARETNFNIPSQPVVFTKPADSIAAPFDDIHVHAEAQSQLDYEGELCFIFGKDCKDVTESDAMDCVLGYTIGNDLSARNYIPQEISGFQMSYGKSFDAFAPFGPYIVHPRIVGDPHQLQLTTKVNGEIRQNEKTSNMIWKIRQIIPHLTRGRTVRAGTVCMTGTPSGVGWFMHPTGYVKHGDEVEVTIEKLGSIKNKGVPRHALYSASKAAVQGMVKCLAWDFGSRGITVNCIAPGGVKTDMYAEAAAKYLKGGDKMSIEEVDGKISEMSPLGRPGFPNDIAGVIAMLASPEAQWITGQTIHASGGAHMG